MVSLRRYSLWPDLALSDCFWSYFIRIGFIRRKDLIHKIICDKNSNGQNHRE